MSVTKERLAARDVEPLDAELERVPHERPQRARPP